MTPEAQAEAQTKAADEWSLVRQMSIYKLLVVESEKREAQATTDLAAEKINTDEWRKVYLREQDIQAWFYGLEQVADAFAVTEETYDD